jgi:hypothetical protein
MVLIGKIFAEALDGLEESAPLHATSDSRHDDCKSSPIPYQPQTENASAAARSSSAGSGPPSPGLAGATTPTNLLSSSSTLRTATPDALPRAPSMDFSAMQLEIDRAHEAANRAARDTLKSIFPTVEDSVADMILEATNGDVGQAIDQLLDMIS